MSDYPLELISSWAALRHITKLYEFNSQLKVLTLLESIVVFQHDDFYVHPNIKLFPTAPTETSNGTFTTGTTSNSTDDTPTITTANTTTTMSTTQGTQTSILQNPTSRPTKAT